MNGKIKRRAFILSLIGLGAAVYIGSWWLVAVRPRDGTRFVETVLRKKLDYLDLDPTGVKQFADEFQGRLTDRQRYRCSWLGLLNPLYMAIDIVGILPQSAKIRDLESRIVTQYLLSSDFFEHQADSRRVVQYIMYYDTWEVGCSNPFTEY